MALAIESQNVTRRILKNSEGNSLIFKMGLKGKMEDNYVWKTFPDPDSPGTCEEDEGLSLAVLAFRALGVLAVPSPAAVFPCVRARGVHQL